MLQKLTPMFIFIALMNTPIAFAWEEGVDYEVSGAALQKANIPVGLVRGHYDLEGTNLFIRGQISRDFPGFFSVIKTFTAYWQKDHWVLGQEMFLPQAPEVFKDSKKAPSFASLQLKIWPVNSPKG